METARRAEDEGLDGVFVFDHLWPIGQPDRPALHGMSMLAAVAAETERISLGTLVARVSLLPDAVLVHQFETLVRIAGRRVIAGIGTGDRKSEPENLAYGVPFPSRPDRIARLRDCATRLHALGIPTWIGSNAEDGHAVAADSADAVNLWEAEADRVGETLARLAPSGTEVTWAGAIEADARTAASRLEAIRDAGAAWAVCAPFALEGAREKVELLTGVAAALH